MTKKASKKREERRAAEAALKKLVAWIEEKDKTPEQRIQESVERLSARVAAAGKRSGGHLNRMKASPSPRG